MRTLRVISVFSNGKTKKKSMIEDIHQSILTDDLQHRLKFDHRIEKHDSFHDVNFELTIDFHSVVFSVSLLFDNHVLDNLSIISR